MEAESWGGPRFLSPLVSANPQPPQGALAPFVDAWLQITRGRACSLFLLRASWTGHPWRYRQPKDTLPTTGTADTRTLETDSFTNTDLLVRCPGGHMMTGEDTDPDYTGLAGQRSRS